MKFTGLVWRHIPAGSYSLHTGFILRAGGRWNRRGEYGCLYASLTRDGAIAEYQKEVVRRFGIDASTDIPRDLVSIHVEIAPVLDLSDDRRRRRSGLTLAAITGDSDDDLESCRTVADIARMEGYEAILSPSAALPNGRNLNIYIDGLAAHVRLTDGPDREPLNY